MVSKIRNIKIWLIFALVLGLIYPVSAQTDLSIGDLIEEIASNTDEELDYTSLYEDLNYFLNNPLNLNTATKNDLERLQILNDFQISSLLDYIKQNGKMLSVYELQLVYGFTFDDIMNVLPFVSVSEITKDEKLSLQNAIKYGNHQLFIRTQNVLEEQVGYSPISDSALLANSNARYLGNSYKLYTKYKYNYKDKIYWGITAEKDPGEEFFAGSNPNGFDFYSAHLQLNHIGIFKTITLGDFQAKFGQGLVLWSDMGFGKGPYVLNLRKKAQGLRKYSSTNENVFMRGVGTTISLSSFDITAFYSNKKIDANITDSTDNEISSVSSFQNSGYHATPSEIEDKDAIREQIIGANISYNHKTFKIGLTAVNYQYSASLLKDTTPENQFKFQGSENSNLSFDYQFGFWDFSFFGEEAISANGSMAFLNGMLVRLAPQISLSALHRHYDKNYQANYANAFSEASGTNNESGFYFGLELHPAKYWTIKLFYDSYRFPWIKTGADAPSNGTEWFFQTDYQPNRNLSMYLRIKNEEKLVNDNNVSGIKNLTGQSLFKFRYQLNYRVNEQVALKSRIETSSYQKSGLTEDGYMIYQDIFYDFEKIPLSFNMRYAMFNTDSYNTRIYAYESDILYAFSIPAYYSKGSRFYVNLKYTLLDFIDIWLKYSQSYYSDLDVISSGLNQINGNTKSEIKAQVRIKF